MSIKNPLEEKIAKLSETQKIPLRLPAELKDKLSKVAASHGLSESEVIICSIRSFIKIVGQDKIKALYYILENFKPYEDMKAESTLSFRCPTVMIEQLDSLDDNRSRILNQIIAWRMASVKITVPQIHISEADQREIAKNPLKLLAKYEKDTKRLEAKIKRLNK